MLDLVGNQDCWFSHAKAHLYPLDLHTCMHIEEICVEMFIKLDGVNVESRPLTRQDSESCLNTVKRFSVG